jgi:hypothetical protein
VVDELRAGAVQSKKREERKQVLLRKTVAALVALYKKHNDLPKAIKIKDLAGVTVIGMIDNILKHEFSED